MTRPHPSSSPITPLTRSQLAFAAGVPGVRCDNGRLLIPFFGAFHTITETGVTGPGGNLPTPAVAEVLRDYVVHCPESPPSENRLISFRELEGAGPLVVSFANNTNKTITSTFAGKLEKLRRAAAKLSGTPASDTDGYDLFIRFEALPGVPIHLRFNDAEDPFPAQCSLLLHASVEAYLGMQAIFTLGTFLCGRLAGDSYNARYGEKIL
jgi:hypothetical protein